MSQENMDRVVEGAKEALEGAREEATEVLRRLRGNAEKTFARAEDAVQRAAESPRGQQLLGAIRRGFTNLATAILEEVGDDDQKKAAAGIKAAAERKAKRRKDLEIKLELLRAHAHGTFAEAKERIADREKMKSDPKWSQRLAAAYGSCRGKNRGKFVAELCVGMPMSERKALLAELATLYSTLEGRVMATELAVEAGISLG